MKHLSRRAFVAATAATAAGIGWRSAGGAAIAADDPEKLYAAAKAEGSVTWRLSSYSEDTAEAVRDAFVAKYPGIVAVLKNAPHPNAARLLEGFYFSPEYSRVMAKTFNFPIRSDVPSGTGLSLAKMRYTRMSADRMLAALPEVIAKWRQIFGA